MTIAFNTNHVVSPVYAHHNTVHSISCRHVASMSQAEYAEMQFVWQSIYVNIYFEMISHCETLILSNPILVQVPCLSINCCLLRVSDKEAKILHWLARLEESFLRYECDMRSTVTSLLYIITWFIYIDLDSLSDFDNPIVSITQLSVIFTGRYQLWHSTCLQWLSHFDCQWDPFMLIDWPTSWGIRRTEWESSTSTTPESLLRAVDGTPVTAMIAAIAATPALIPSSMIPIYNFEYIMLRWMCIFTKDTNYLNKAPKIEQKLKKSTGHKRNRNFWMPWSFVAPGPLWKIEEIDECLSQIRSFGYNLNGFLK